MTGGRVLGHTAAMTTPLLGQHCVLYLGATRASGTSAVIELWPDVVRVARTERVGGALTTTVLEARPDRLTVGGFGASLSLRVGRGPVTRVDLNPESGLAAAAGRLSATELAAQESGVESWLTALRVHGARVTYLTAGRLMGLLLAGVGALVALITVVVVLGRV